MDKEYNLLRIFYRLVVKPIITGYEIIATDPLRLRERGLIGLIKCDD